MKINKKYHPIIPLIIATGLFIKFLIIGDYHSGIWMCFMFTWWSHENSLLNIKNEK